MIDMGEFDFITHYFRPLAGQAAFELRNDGAAFSIDSTQEIVISSDTMVENVHFLPEDAPFSIAVKLLGCNLSDLAAMGAKPYGYSLNISVPQTEEGKRRYHSQWFAEFSRGLKTTQEKYHFSLLGGDTTSIHGPLVMSVTIFGLTNKGQVLHRNKSKIGDNVWVTGRIGQAALGLAARLGKIPDPTGQLLDAYLHPRPRIGLFLFPFVHSVMDISDGILQDAGHIARESGVGITLYEEAFPFTPEARATGEDWRETRLLGGDDYELLITCPPQKEHGLMNECARCQIPITKIGYVHSGKNVQILDKNAHPISFSKTGWQHF